MVRAVFFITFVLVAAACTRPVDDSVWADSMKRVAGRFEQLDADPALLSDRGWVADTVQILTEAETATAALADQVPAQAATLDRLTGALISARSNIERGNVIGLIQAMRVIEGTELTE